MLADVIVLGAGVVGLAVARELAAAGRRVVVIERHPRPGMETSSRNSEVIHAGMYYPPGTLKARLCVPGSRSLYEWCGRHRVGARRIGKFIVATRPEEEPELDRLLARATENGVAGLRRATLRELHDAEPDVSAVAALWSPDTGIVDSHGLVRSLEQEATNFGSTMAYGHTFVAAEAGSAGYRMVCREPSGEEVAIDARVVVNSAGLEADLVAASVGIDVDRCQYRQVMVKGSYFRLAEGAPFVLRHLVYPVPNPGLTGLGVHVTVDLEGGVRFGPDVQFLPGRSIDYGVPPERAPEFAERARHYLPALRAEHLRPDQSGVRPRRKLDGNTVPDFIIGEESARGLPGWVNLIGMESPALTSCLEIARAVRALLD